MTKNNSLRYWHELCARMLAEADSLPLGEQRESFRHSIAHAIKKAGINDTEFAVHGVEALEQLRKARHSLSLSGVDAADYRQIDASIQTLEPLVSLKEACERVRVISKSVYWSITVIEVVGTLCFSLLMYLLISLTH
ncbi:hypothetical protein C7431_11060 [Pantoea allii]|uniref:Uncharacterized protein n=1 Tax=Pantoea allii TaxID=574096 RepID=A0A2V2B5D6_9GAMM|nr:hypothetical protein [Pantoea allii]PWK94566.1 hypothetical protein C7431_11060 [Pantoea allii]